MSRQNPLRTRVWRRAGALLAATGLTAALLLTPASSAVAAQAPATGATFNKPTGTTTEENAILSHVGSLVHGATAGSRIRIAMYIFGSQWLANELVAAKGRGVQVQVLLDHTSRTNVEGEATYGLLAGGLGTDPAAPSWVLSCPADGACLGEDTDPNDAYHPSNHNKFYLLSRTSGAAQDDTLALSNVVVQSSANLTTWDRTKAWNDALTVVDNAALYGAYSQYFTDLTAAALGQRERTDNYPVSAEAGAAKAYFFPRSGAADDVIVNILNAVDDPIGSSATCHGNADGYGTTDGRTVIRIAVHQITRIEVARKLWELDNAGCYVDIVYRRLDNTGTAVTDQLTKPTAYGGIALHQLDDQDDAAATHSKYLLVEGGYLGSPNKKIVFTGSHPYTISALRMNDEALLKYTDPGVFDAYRKNFWDQRAAA
ncbi:phospholipase D-like domain-containing protein [Micromonospora sp. DT47]|uniref:phospholipase D-like domain-containing protein n=1 Tax=Micromonospora sp. DT47 TaxID=3393431 RepID=UPI003CE852EC